MRGIDDDELSHRSGSLSRTSSGRSFNGGFSVDWDEIESMAEESLSVASSASSGHRKRKTSSRRRQQGTSQLDALESGSLSRYTGNNTTSRSTGSRSSGSRQSANKSRSTPILTCTPTSKRQKGKLKDLKRIIMIGILVLFATLSIHLCGQYLEQILKSYQTITFVGSGLAGGDRIARRMLSKSTATYQTRHWPLTVREEENDFELLSHPANDKVTLSVPRFFLQAEDGSMETLGRIRSLSRNLANMVGRTTVDGSRDFSVRTIFVGIASFRDWHCRYTVESLFLRAKYPERIRVGVVDQLRPDEDQSCDVPIVTCEERPRQALCKYRDQIDVYEMQSQLAVGPTFARHVTNRLYRGEYYALQITSHTTFAKHWDVELIEQMEETGNDMAVISTYLNEAVGSVDDKTGISQKESRLVLCSAGYEGEGHKRRLRHDFDQQPDMLPGVQGMPQLQPYWSSSFSFSRGHFILTVPYDPYLPMAKREDEEISMALRAFSHGYDFYTPEKSVCFDSGDKESLKSFLSHENLYKG